MKAKEQKRTPKKCPHRGEEEVEVPSFLATHPLCVKIAEGICFGIALGVTEYCIGKTWEEKEREQKKAKRKSCKKSKKK